MPENQAIAPLQVTPQIAHAAIAQAEKEEAEFAKQHQGQELDRMLPDGEIRIGGYKAHKMSFARTGILVGALGLDSEDAEDKDNDLAANMEAVQVAVYILFESSIARLHQLSKKTDGIMQAALTFADEVDSQVFSRMAQYAIDKMNDLQSANMIGAGPGDGMPSSPDPEGDQAEKK